MCPASTLATRLRLSAAALCTWVGLAAPALAQTPIDADEIVARSVERARFQREQEADLGYQSVYVMLEESLDGDGQVQETERRTYRRYPLEGAIYDELIAVEGEPLAEKTVREERERREKFLEDVRKRRANGQPPQPEDENAVEFDEDFVSRYRFTLVGEETVDTHPSWMLSFEPRDGDLPVRRRIDHALNNAIGRIWVSQDDYGVARVEFEMSRSVRFWGGIIGTLRNTVGRLQFDRIDEGVWLPVDMNIRLDLRIFFSSIRRRIIMDWQEYQRFGDVARATR